MVGLSKEKYECVMNYGSRYTYWLANDKQKKEVELWQVIS